jgi:hypothetical protein
MQKSREYILTKFTPDVIKLALVKVQELLPKKHIESFSVRALVVQLNEETWNHDSIEEFYSDYRKDIKNAHIHAFSVLSGHEVELALNYYPEGTNISVEASSRAEIESVFEIFNDAELECKLPVPKRKEPTPPPPPTIFIGHGRSSQWRDLKDHLQDKHGYIIEAYEVGERAGHGIRDILEDMMTKSSFAVLVMTGEDRDSEGLMHARENVVHEMGLFQGCLGFSRAIVLLEDETAEFSNIHGIHQIRYSKGKIKETFGEILATLRREFHL